MDDSRQSYRTLLEIQVESLQEHLDVLERDPEQVEPLKCILRCAQRLRHEREDEEPLPVSLLRNAVEKVTLHLGHANLKVSQEFLDFYLDTFDLLEESVRRWPEGASFDRSRYADRVRSLLEVAEPVRSWAAARDGGKTSVEIERPEKGRGDEVLAESPGDGSAFVAEGLSPREAPERIDSEPAVVDEAALQRDAAVLAPMGDVPTWSDSKSGSQVELLRASDMGTEERELFVEMDLRDLLVEPWTEPAAAGAGTADVWTGSAPAELAPAGATEPYPRDGAAATRETAPADAEELSGLAASFATFEALRSGSVAEESGDGPGAVPLMMEPEPETRAALEGVRDGLDALSVSLSELDARVDQLLAERPASLGESTLMALVERLELEREKLLSGFDRRIDDFRDALEFARSENFPRSTG